MSQDEKKKTEEETKKEAENKQEDVEEKIKEEVSEAKEKEAEEKDENANEADDKEKAEEVAEQEVLEEEEIPEPDPEIEEIDKKEEEKLLKAEESKIEEFRTGDTVRIYYKIIEGENTRIQPFEGIVIAKKGKGVSKTFTVRRIGADGVSIERIFPLESPNITKLEVKRHGKVRKSKLYYLRKKKGRAAVRVKDRKVK